MTTDRRLVIDTNLWISRLLVPDGVAAQAVDHGSAWGMPLMSQATLAELAEVLSGGWQLKRTVVLEFPSVAAVKAFWDSPEYQPLRAIRERAAKSNLVLVEGV